MGLTAARATRLRSLGVDDAFLPDEASVTESPLTGFPSLAPATGSTLRILQWNLLADGMADDAFLTSDVLRVGVGDSRLDVRAMAAAITSERRAGSVVGQADPRSRARQERNLAVHIDWEARWVGIRAAIERLQPDVITMQEMDHMAVAQPALLELGYACGIDGAVYAPAHAAGLSDDPDALVAHLERGPRVAFAPKGLASTCRKLKLKMGRGSTPADADNDGVAIFWRAPSLHASAIEYRHLATTTPSKQPSVAVRVTLTRIADGARMRVL